MNTKPMLFSTDMIRALLDGRKTQTRRIVKPQALINDNGILEPNGMTASMWRKVSRELPESFGANYFSPYGQPGDLIWVRETFAIYQGHSDSVPLYKTGTHDDLLKWIPSIHMPRWASRLTLKITDVRIERLQDISKEDAEAEGLKKWPHKGDFAWGYDGCSEDGHGSPTGAFHSLWNSIYPDDDWYSNPWVWVYSFEVIKKNVDAVLNDH